MEQQTQDDYRDVTDELGSRKVSEESQEKLPGMGKGFWSRNGATVITLVILGLIIGGAIAVNERRGAERNGDDLAAVGENGEQRTPDFSIGGEVGSGSTSSPDTNGQQPVTSAPLNGIRITESETEGKLVATSFELVAQKGEGRTHLARRAITEQLRRTSTNLSPEQRVYAEDYLQKKYAPKVPLHPGSTITFTADQVNESISASQSLNSAQLQNLQQYSVLVNWPPI